MNDLKNLCLRLRYNFLPVSEPDKIFDGKILYEKTSFRDMSGLMVKDNEFYNNNDVFFSAKAVRATIDDKLAISLYKDPATRATWQGIRHTNFTSGMVETPFIPGATMWEIEARAPKLWPALWLLRKEHTTPDGIEGAITPEIDIMEVIKGRFQHTIHYKPTADRYSTKGCHNHVRYDNEWHVFGVELLPDGYDFYIDGFLTGSFRSKDVDFTSPTDCRLLINNAIMPGQYLSPWGHVNTFYINSIRAYGV